MDRTQLRREVKELITTGLRLETSPEKIDDEAPIFGEAFGLDSIDALELVVLVEERFGVSIPDEDAGRRAFASVSALADYIVAARAAA